MAFMSQGLGRPHGDACKVCKETAYCTACVPSCAPNCLQWRSLRSEHIPVKPSCSLCRTKFQIRIDVLLAELTRHQKAYEARLAFLTLKDPAPCTETLKGDVALIVQGMDHQPIYSHRFILANKSSVFSKMFQNDMLEKQTGVIHIHDASYPVMDAVISFCHSAHIRFTEEVPPDEVLEVAHKYAIEYLKDLCVDELRKRIDDETLPQMLRLSKKFDAKILQEAATKYLKDNFDTAFANVFNEY